MKKEYLISIVLLVMLVAFIMPVSAMSSPAIINVPSDYATIQDAINVAKPGDTIRVDSGVYREHVIVNKTVSLIGAGSFSTFIDGMGAGDVVKINASCVLVKGFTIQNGTTGIRIENCSYNTIVENEITDVDFGITLYDSCYGNSIIDNKITICSMGIWVWYSNSNLISDNYIANIGNQGIDIAHSDCNRIVNNTISDTDTGILTRSCIGNSLIDNYISENRYGIMTGRGTGYEANDHIVSCNTIISNTETGILMYAGKNNTFCYNAITNNAKGITTWTSGNSFYHNTIIANSVQVDPAGNVNTWHEGYPSGGNYWSDHPNPVDTNNDGICDTPYDIDMLNHDIYPFCNPLPKPMPGPNIIHVPSQYLTIVDAIEAAKPGDTILVSSGVYPEHVVVNKPVSLVGAGSGVTYIEGGGTGTVVYINASNVLVKGFTIWNGTRGIHIFNCSCDVITENNVIFNKGKHILLTHATGTNIVDNIIAHHYDGWPSYGIWLTHSNCSLISNNYIAHVGGNGIHIEKSPPAKPIPSICNWIIENIIASNHYGIVIDHSHGGAIMENYMHDNYCGIWLPSSYDQVISCNTITNNKGAGGILIGEGSRHVVCCNTITKNNVGITVLADGNSIYHNTFKDNPIQASAGASYVNRWDEGCPSGGNYWSNYAGPDNTRCQDGAPGSDGIGDISYNIAPPNNVDNYPLMNPLPKPLKTIFIAHFMTPEGEPYPFDVIISDGIWKKEFKNVTYIETEVPCTATYYIQYKVGSHTMFGDASLCISSGEIREFNFYAFDPLDSVERIKPYIFCEERDANASISYTYDNLTKTLSMNLTGQPDKVVLPKVFIDKNIFDPPNFVLKGVTVNGEELAELLSHWCWFWCHVEPYVEPSYDDKGIQVDNSFGIRLHFSPGYNITLQFDEIQENKRIVSLRGLFYNYSRVEISETKLLNATDVSVTYSPTHAWPEFVVPPSSYIYYMDVAEDNAIDWLLPVDLVPYTSTIFDAYVAKIADLDLFTFSVAAESPFAKSSYSDLTHNEENKTITVNVSTETDNDWWGYFVLPDTATVAAARAYDGVDWSVLHELYDYTINHVNGHKIVVVRITPETEQLLLKYSPVPIPVLAFYPPEVDIPLDSTKTVNLTLSSAPNGLSGYNLTVSLSNSSVAEILSVNFPDWATLYDNSMLPSDSVWIKATDLNDRIKRGESNITLATLIIRGDKQGKSDIFINATKIDDDDGNPIYPITIPGQVNVVPSCGITFPSCTNPPTDPDNDGLCEDTNGNVRKDFYDVIVFFKNLEWVEKNQPIERYDFNGNGHIDFNDIVKLFEEI